MTTPTPTDLTLPERRADEVLEIIREQRRKGRATYGKGLDHRDAYDWQRMAIEELVDAVQYLAAENLRLRDRCAVLDAARAVEPLQTSICESDWQAEAYEPEGSIGSGSEAYDPGPFASEQPGNYDVRRFALRLIRTGLDILERER